jgi:hypothetical protein
VDKTEILPRFPVSLVAIGMTTSVVFSALACLMTASIPVATEVTVPAVIGCIDVSPEKRTDGDSIPSPHKRPMALGSLPGPQKVSAVDHVSAEIPAGYELGLVPGKELRIGVVDWSRRSKPEVQGTVIEVKPPKGGGPSQVVVALSANGIFDRICRQSHMGAIAATIRVCCERRKLISEIISRQSE